MQEQRIAQHLRLGGRQLGLLLRELRLRAAHLVGLRKAVEQRDAQRQRRGALDARQRLLVWLLPLFRAAIGFFSDFQNSFIRVIGDHKKCFRCHLQIGVCQQFGNRRLGHFQFLCFYLAGLRIFSAKS